MAQYTIEQQRLDKALLDATIANLGAKSIGEKQDFFDNHMEDFIRIHRLWAHPKLGNPMKQKEFRAMYHAFYENPRISAWMIEPYERLLKDTKKLVSMLIFRRKRKPEDTCEQPDIHIQKCYCANMHKAMLLNRVVPVE